MAIVAPGVTQTLPTPQTPIVDPATGELTLDGYKYFTGLIDQILSAYPTATVAANVLATGATQATAVQMSSQVNTVTGQKSGGTGVMLGALSAGQAQTVRNRSGVQINVYPPPGSQIEALGNNVASPLANNADATYFFDAATQIRT